MLAFFLPLSVYLQSVLGLSALAAGLCMLPVPLTVLVLNFFVANRLAARLGARWTLSIGLACVGAGSAILGLSTGASAVWATLLPGLVLFAVGPGLIYAPLMTAAVRHVPADLAGAASGVLGTSGQLGGVFGSAIVGALFQSAPSRVDTLHTALLIPMVVAVAGIIACLFMETDQPPAMAALARRRIQKPRNRVYTA
jgi:MFS family permease